MSRHYIPLPNICTRNWCGISFLERSFQCYQDTYSVFGQLSIWTHVFLLFSLLFWALKVYDIIFTWEIYWFKNKLTASAKKTCSSIAPSCSYLPNRDIDLTNVVKVDALVVCPKNQVLKIVVKQGYNYGCCESVPSKLAFNLFSIIPFMLCSGYCDRYVLLTRNDLKLIDQK